MICNSGSAGSVESETALAGCRADVGSARESSRFSYLIPLFHLTPLPSFSTSSWPMRANVEAVDDRHVCPRPIL